MSQPIRIASRSRPASPAVAVAGPQASSSTPSPAIKVQRKQASSPLSVSSAADAPMDAAPVAPITDAPAPPPTPPTGASANGSAPSPATASPSFKILKRRPKGDGSTRKSALTTAQTADTPVTASAAGDRTAVGGETDLESRAREREQQYQRARERILGEEAGAATTASGSDVSGPDAATAATAASLTALTKSTTAAATASPQRAGSGSSAVRIAVPPLYTPISRDEMVEYRRHPQPQYYQHQQQYHHQQQHQYQYQQEYQQQYQQYQQQQEYYYYYQQQQQQHGTVDCYPPPPPPAAVSHHDPPPPSQPPVMRQPSTSAPRATTRRSPPRLPAATIAPTPAPAVIAPAPPVAAVTAVPHRPVAMSAPMAIGIVRLPGVPNWLIPPPPTAAELRAMRLPAPSRPPPFPVTAVLNPRPYVLFPVIGAVPVDQSPTSSRTATTTAVVAPIASTLEQLNAAIAAVKLSGGDGGSA
ncbi:hypothetical protein BC828DRAFT_385005 [Blastocladiella britannica]|nr:hypothetical protein BC828DRAFT_385005 [Blastocladiella britannica]